MPVHWRFLHTVWLISWLCLTSFVYKINKEAQQICTGDLISRRVPETNWAQLDTLESILLSIDVQIYEGALCKKPSYSKTAQSWWHYRSSPGVHRPHATAKHHLYSTNANCRISKRLHKVLEATSLISLGLTLLNFFLDAIIMHDFSQNFMWEIYLTRHSSRGTSVPGNLWCQLFIV